MIKVTIKMVCENEECEKLGEVINEVSRECDTKEEAENEVELFIENFGSGSEDDVDYCPACGELAIVQDPEYREIVAPATEESEEAGAVFQGDYSTTCPYCKKEDCLRVVHFTANTSIPLQPDGFATTDAKFFDTSDEIVHCQECNKEFSLSEVMR